MQGGESRGRAHVRGLCVNQKQANPVQWKVLHYSVRVHCNSGVDTCCCEAAVPDVIAPAETPRVETTMTATGYETQNHHLP